MNKTLFLGAWLIAASFVANASDAPPQPTNLILEGTFPSAMLLHVSLSGGKESVEYTLPLTQAGLVAGVHSPVATTRSIKEWA